MFDGVAAVLLCLIAVTIFCQPSALALHPVPHSQSRDDMAGDHGQIMFDHQLHLSMKFQLFPSWANCNRHDPPTHSEATQEYNHYVEFRPRLARDQYSSWPNKRTVRPWEVHSTPKAAGSGPPRCVGEQFVHFTAIYVNWPWKGEGGGRHRMSSSLWCHKVNIVSIGCGVFL